MQNNYVALYLDFTFKIYTCVMTAVFFSCFYAFPFMSDSWISIKMYNHAWCSCGLLSALILAGALFLQHFLSKQCKGKTN